MILQIFISIIIKLMSPIYPYTGYWVGLVLNWYNCIQFIQLSIFIKKCLKTDHR